MVKARCRQEVNVNTGTDRELTVQQVITGQSPTETVTINNRWRQQNNTNNNVNNNVNKEQQQQQCQ